MIKVNNIDKIKNLSNYKLKRKKKFGIILSIASIGAIVSSLASINNNGGDSYNLDINIPPSCNISSDEINDMNIIINDSNCSDSFFNEICSILSNDGIIFSTTKDCIDINKDNCVIVTLDQQYSSGSNTLIFAPYSNTRLGNSDSLALAMKCAFDQNCFFVDDVLCSQIGFEQDEFGNVIYSIATDTEKVIDLDKDTSFVTISFGTTNINAEWTAKSIENGLARQNSYISNYDTGNDLIYCASQTDTIDKIANYFDVDSEELINYNKISDNKVTDAQAIVNPNIQSMKEFSKDYIFEIDNVKTRSY